MSKPLMGAPERKSEASAFHRAVVKAHGKRCHFCGTEPEQVDAMHVIARSKLGKNARYAFPELNGRPGCRRCHRLQEVGHLEFSLADRVAAIRALNTMMKVPLREPAA